MTDTSQQDDIQELIRSIHAERQAAKEKERREGWTRYVSLMIVLLAVATAIGSLKAGGFGSKVMLYQAQASDTWAFYQAKSIKQRIAEMEARRSTGDEAAAAAADVERYRTEENDLQAKAEGARGRARRDGQARPAAGLRDRAPADRDRAGLDLPHHQAQAALGGVGAAGRRRDRLRHLRPLLRLSEDLRVEAAGQLRQRLDRVV